MNGWADTSFNPEGAIFTTDGTIYTVGPDVELVIKHHADTIYWCPDCQAIVPEGHAHGYDWREAFRGGGCE